jgi:nucleoside 2-deoxyribosyltransferase
MPHLRRRGAIPPWPPVIYVAGPLFTPGERRLVESVAATCARAGFRSFVPHRDAGLFGPRRGRAARLFQADLAGLAVARCLVAVLNGPEVAPGTAWEVGYLYVEACAHPRLRR